MKAKICSKPNEYEFNSYMSFWKENKEMNIFASKKQYEEMHYKNDVQLEYLSDFEKVSNEDARLILMEYLDKKHITIEELQKDKQKLYEFCNICKIQYKISNRKLEKITKVNREKIRRILMKSVPKGTSLFDTK